MGETEHDDDDRTPAETPASKSKLALGLESCPACERSGVTTTGEVCFFCKGGRVVTEKQAAEWRKAHR